MDLLTIAYVVMFAFGIMSVDTVIHADSIVVEVNSGGSIGSAQMEQPLVAGIVDAEIRRVAATRSIVADPEIIMGNQKSVAMALADVVKVRPVAVALQSQFGYEPMALTFDVFTEAGTPQIMVSGRGPGHVGDFEELVVQRKNETVPDLLRRSVLIAMSRLDPYTTALYLLDSYASGSEQGPEEVDVDRLDAAESLALRAKSMLPPATISPRRSLFDNLLGTVALFRNNPDAAREAYASAVAANPANVVAILNLTFVDLKLKKYSMSAQRIAQLLDEQKPSNPVLLTIAYQMQALANAGLGQNDQADRSFALAVETLPERPSTYEYWANVKRKRGDDSGAELLHAQSLAHRGKYTNYSEVATMYFSLSDEGQNGQVLVRTPFTVPPVVSFR
jgi:predicted Zn-dependent protease